MVTSSGSMSGSGRVASRRAAAPFVASAWASATATARAAQFNATAARVRTDARSASSQASASRFNEASASLHFFAARRHRALRFARAARRSTLKIAPGAIVASTTNTPR